LSSIWRRGGRGQLEQIKKKEEQAGDITRPNFESENLILDITGKPAKKGEAICLAGLAGRIATFLRFVLT